MRSPTWSNTKPSTSKLSSDNVERESPAPVMVQAPIVASRPRFKVSDDVALVSDPSKNGTVIKGPRQYSNGLEYLVTIGGNKQWFNESALKPSMAGIPHWGLSHAEFLRDLVLVKLSNRLTDTLYSYGTSRTRFVPYQFRPVLKFLKNPDQPRILIADEVGLGKTIEAAIIYFELKARMDISGVLVLCPSRLKGQMERRVIESI